MEMNHATLACACIQVHTHVHGHMHTRTYAHVHLCAHSPTHTHTQRQRKVLEIGEEHCDDGACVSTHTLGGSMDMFPQKTSKIRSLMRSYLYPNATSLTRVHAWRE